MAVRDTAVQDQFAWAGGDEVFAKNASESSEVTVSLAVQ